MHVLIRRVSAYTANDLLLGVFRTVEQAQAARDVYVTSVLGGGRDPWAEQAYRQVSEEDVEILPAILHLDVADGAERVFVLSSYAEGFGQTDRCFEALAGSEEVARRHGAVLEAGQDPDGLPWYWDVFEVRVGDLLSPGQVGGLSDLPPDHWERANT